MRLPGHFVTDGHSPPSITIMMALGSRWSANAIRDLLQRTFLAGTVLFVFVPPIDAQQVAAQDRSHKLEYFLQIGGSFFSSTSSSSQRILIDIETGDTLLIPARSTNSMSTSARLFGGARFYWTRQDAIELSYSGGPNNVIFRNRREVPTPPIPEVREDRDTSAHFLSANYVHYLRRGGQLQPFITVGFGFALFPGAANSQQVAGNLGGGLDIQLRGNVRLRAEYRAFVFDQPILFIDTPQGKSIHHGPSVGLAFRF